MRQHPSLDITGSTSRLLSGKTVVLAISGSVAAVQTSTLARSLMRHGANVVPVMTQAACRLVGPDLLQWATGNKPITEITGEIEHVAWVGNVAQKADALLVAPATANTIGKIANAIDDTPVTTFATTAIGEKIPVVIVPAMHKSMYDHPGVQDNLKKCADMGIEVFLPREAEGKAKFPDVEKIVSFMIRLLSKKPLAGKRVLITAGRTVEPIDPIRVITNNSTGKMGFALARNAWLLGAEVIMVLGKVTETPETQWTSISAPTAEKMKDVVFDLLNTKRIDYMIAAAAVGDWQCEEISAVKIPASSGSRLNLTLVPTQKIVDSVKQKSPSTKLVIFRAQAGMSEQELIEDAKERLNRADADFIAANDTSKPGAGFEGDTNEIILIGKSGEIQKLALDSKDRIAARILEQICR